MGQPIKRGRKEPPSVTHVQGTGKGVEYCNDCPFLSLYPDRGFALCNASDIEFYYKEGNLIEVPKNCGNHKNDENRIQGKQ